MAASAVLTVAESSAESEYQAKTVESVRPAQAGPGVVSSSRGLSVLKAERSQAGALFEFEENDQPDAEELHFARGDVALCFLINRRTRSMRVIDFRSGCQTQKQSLVNEIAQREGIRRAFVVAEREEGNSWAKIGFQKEGSIPGFYKRSDAYLLSKQFDISIPRESGVRMKAAGPKGDRLEKAGLERAERAYTAGRRLVRNKAPEALPKVKVAVAREKDIQKALSLADKTGRFLTRFEPFGRDVKPTQYLCTARGGFSLLVNVESQPCFDNAYLDLLSAPRGEKEVWLAASSLKLLGEQLLDSGIVSAFSITPTSSVELTAAMLTSGFRKTGRLEKHMIVQGQPTDAFLWSRKLAEP
jgi:hypothetical protein